MPPKAPPKAAARLPEPAADGAGGSVDATSSPPRDVAGDAAAEARISDAMTGFGPLVGGVDADVDAEMDGTVLLMREIQFFEQAHKAPVSALHHCASRGMLCSGGADGTVCVWALAARDIKKATTRLLGKLGAPAPMGSIRSLATTQPRDGGAPRVIAAGGNGFLYEWHLRGGYVCRALERVPGGLSALAVDKRADGSSIWVGRADGTVQLWRWPNTSAAPIDKELGPTNSQPAYDSLPRCLHGTCVTHVTYVT